MSKNDQWFDEKIQNREDHIAEAKACLEEIDKGLVGGSAKFIRSIIRQDKKAIERLQKQKSEL